MIDPTKKRLIKEITVTDELLLEEPETLLDLITRLQELHKQYGDMFEVLTITPCEHCPEYGNTYYTYSLQGDRYESDEEVSRRLEVVRKQEETRKANAERRKAGTERRIAKEKEQRRKAFLEMKKEFEP